MVKRNRWAIPLKRKRRPFHVKRCECGSSLFSLHHCSFMCRTCRDGTCTLEKVAPILPSAQTYPQLLSSSVQIPIKWEFPKLREPPVPLLPSLPINPTFNLGTTEISSLQQMPPNLIEIKPEIAAIEWVKLLGMISLVSVGLIVVTAVVSAELDDERERRIELEQELETMFDDNLS
jgi:hypothetical protein